MKEDNYEECSQTIFKPENIFYNLLLRVGGDGKYQYICLALCSYIYMATISALSFLPFLFYQPPYTCNGLSQHQCSIHVCSLPTELRKNFLVNEKQTLVNQFGDYRCQKLSEINLIQTFIYLSGLIGIIIGSWINSSIRKKLIIEVSFFISLLSYICLLFVPSLTWMVFFLCINYACQTIIIELVRCYISQNVIEAERGKHTMVLFIFSCLGTIANGFFFGILTWQSVLSYYFIVPTAIVFIGLKFYIKDTPFDLVTNFPPENSLAALSWIAKQNGKQQTHKITLKQITTLKRSYEQNLQRKSQKNISMLDLFKYKSLRPVVISCFLLHFFIYFNWITPILALDQFSTDIYTNDIIFSVAALISSIFCYFFIDKFPRIKTINYTTLASLVFIIPLYMESNCKENCQFDNNLTNSITIFLFRMIVEVSDQVYYFIQNQNFPTQIRSIASLVSASSMIISKIFVPVIVELNQQAKLVLPCSFIVSGIAILLVASRIKETVGIPPPQLIRQLSYKQCTQFQMK